MINLHKISIQQERRSLGNVFQLIAITHKETIIKALTISESSLSTVKKKNGNNGIPYGN